MRPIMLSTNLLYFDMYMAGIFGVCMAPERKRVVERVLIWGINGIWWGLLQIPFIWTKAELKPPH